MAPEIVTLQAGRLHARFLPGLGMVGVSLRDGPHELLGQRGGLEAYVARGSTFGIPLLHPWANRLGGFAYPSPLNSSRQVLLEAGMPGLRTEEHGLPIHGVLAANPGWKVLARSGKALIASLAYDTPQLLAAFPFPHRLELRAELFERSLVISLILKPTGDTPVPVAFGFHPYLAVDGAREEAQITVPARSRLLLDERGLPTGQREATAPAQVVLGEDHVDGLYGDLTGDPFVLRTARRTLAVRFLEGYDFAQVFAPAGQPVVCFEPMASPTDALRTGRDLRIAEEEYRASFAIELLDGPER